MFGAVIFCFVAIGIIVAVASAQWSSSRGIKLMNQWAGANGFTIIFFAYRPFRMGPFFWTTDKGQRVYYVQFRDAEGSIRNAYIRTRGWMLGMMSDNVEVRWE